MAVSILVFLEPLLRHRRETGLFARDAVSILVFLEPLLRLVELNGEPIWQGEFQSLFFWNHCLD